MRLACLCETIAASIISTINGTTSCTIPSRIWRPFLISRKWLPDTTVTKKHHSTKPYRCQWGNDGMYVLRATSSHWQLPTIAKYLRRIKAIRDRVLLLAEDQRSVHVERPAAVQLPVEKFLWRTEAWVFTILKRNVVPSSYSICTVNE